MSLPEIHFCPGTLAPEFDTYSRTALNRVFNGRKVSHILPYSSPASNVEMDKLFEENRMNISISGVQEKFSVLLDKNKLRLISEGEKGTYILKPIPNAGRIPHEMPANEHVTMQIARQVYGIETAENALIFFSDGSPAYITKRFDVQEDGSKLAQDDFASLAQRTPQTHGENYKYQGNYLEIFQLMQQYLPVYRIEAPKLLKILMFNYLFSNGDAHFKNFSLLETPMGDFRLSPAYDLLNSRIHIEDKPFALEEGLLPRKWSQGSIKSQFFKLSQEAQIEEKTFNVLFDSMASQSEKVYRLIEASYLENRTKRNYLQSYQGRLKQFLK
ncbi:HipA domain-containing protein [Flavobacterium foetidum]|uniref:HipA domain-containing protein n=1 Tax=Flavobacterium foetidum TaxID=2026681 RepID=UPI001074A78F|nr:HipA domain-containing protein [Flavobacterium foetidum]KAF2516664.1 HipA domain-containing protein [Flavobacterium foetidum]